MNLKKLLFSIAFCYVLVGGANAQMVVNHAANNNSLTNTLAANTQGVSSSSLVNDNYLTTYSTDRVQGVSNYGLVSNDSLTNTSADGNSGTVVAESTSFENLINVIKKNWVPLGNSESNKFDFGPLQNIPSINPVEGFRLRAGLATNTRFSPHLFLKGYVAYGFKDQGFKYRTEASYSFSNRLYHANEFPRNNLNLIYENDIYAYGEMSPRMPNDLLLFTYNRSENAMVYRRFTELNYERESLSGLAYMAWVRSSDMKPAAGLTFSRLTKLGETTNVISLRESNVGIQFRFSFDEEYEQNGRKRKSLSLNKPVLLLSHQVGFNGFLGGTVNYHRTDLSIQKRFILGNAGRLDMVADAQRVWNQVPFPLLVYPNQRSFYLIENNRFYLSPIMEFPADQLFALRATFVGEDFLFSKVPFLDKLGIKEVISFRGISSHLSDKNYPTTDNGLFAFPEISTPMGNTPYLEGAIGITNILGLFRLEYVHRFTYLDNPHAMLGKIRFDITL
ncbi:MAG: DUF5686 family protein [Dysgonamonadaceae bacterium]